MEKQSITVTLNQEKLEISLPPQVDFATIMRMYGTLGLHILDTYFQSLELSIDDNPNIPEEDKPNTKSVAKENMYDAFNHIVSNVLTTFAPDNELRSDITYEAIMELENQKLEEQLQKEKQ